MVERTRNGRCWGSLAVGVLLATSALVAAQPPEVKPGPEHKRLGAMVGNWNATVKTQGQESHAQSVNRWGPGHLFVLQNFTGEFGGQKFEGHGITGYDTNKKKYMGVWVDSMSPGLMTTEGTFDEASKTYTEHGEGIGPDGKPFKMKMTTEHPDKDSMVFKMYDVKDGNESLQMTIEYKRAPPKQKQAKPAEKTETSKQ